MRDYILEAPPLRPIYAIAKEVAAKHRVPMRILLSQRRQRELVYARQEAFWRCREETAASFPQIGRVFNRDYSTVIYGARAHERRMTGEVMHANERSPHLGGTDMGA